jgi:hypothetical protein
MPFYTPNDIKKIVGMSRNALDYLWSVGKGPNRIGDGFYRIPKVDALSWAERMAQTAKPVRAPKYVRAAEFMRMDIQLDQHALAV